MKTYAILFAAVLSGLVLNMPLAAQKLSKADVSKVYEPREVTPCSFDVLTTIELIQSRAKYPASVLGKGVSGEVHVAFVVDAVGKVRDAQVQREAYYEPADPAATAAVLSAIKTLPKLSPALHEGKPVAVRMQLAIRYPTPTPSKMYSAGPNRVYTYCEQMPELPGGGGSAGVVVAIQKNLKYPLTQPALPATTANRVFIEFVIGADGVVRDAKVAKGLGAGYDEAALAAVRKLPVFAPGKQNGCPVAVAYTVPVFFSPH